MWHTLIKGIGFIGSFSKLGMIGWRIYAFLMGWKTRRAYPLNTKSFNIILNGWCNMLINLGQAKRFWREWHGRSKDQKEALEKVLNSGGDNPKAPNENRGLEQKLRGTETSEKHSKKPWDTQDTQEDRQTNSNGPLKKKNYCVMGDVYGVLLVPKELELEKDTSFITAYLKFQLPNVGKATKEFFRSREVREFFSGALVGAMTKVVLGPLETISNPMMNHFSDDEEDWLRNSCFDSFTSEDSDFVDVTSMGEGENIEIHENSDRDSDGCEASRVFEADKATFYSMQFKTSEEAFAIYNQYAKLVGFSVRKDTYRMRTNGVRVKRRFLCSATGERNVNRVTPRKCDIESRELKAITKFKCKAHFEVGYDFQSNLWVVKDFIGEHTHSLVPDPSSMFLRSHRNGHGLNKFFIKTIYRVFTGEMKKKTIYEDEDED
ncbi:hypothetical protein IFM89_029556 [Coptis chinensis]|uniref:FAR1 domain-containing protein n=1 Tax=Coptis chinensis TaxID=261450 RepID=A0A835GYP0_9MAGN|nr:hypothetical protein IFM89_029556 [Coptis chinensis]